eukprot:scaffold83254_cov32-Tisochrysis_lutea.AAC.1
MKRLMRVHACIERLPPTQDGRTVHTCIHVHTGEGGLHLCRITLMPMPFLKNKRAQKHASERSGCGETLRQKMPAKVAADQTGRKTIRKSPWIGLTLLEYGDEVRSCMGWYAAGEGYTLTQG